MSLLEKLKERKETQKDPIPNKIRFIDKVALKFNEWGIKDGKLTTNDVNKIQYTSFDINVDKMLLKVIQPEESWNLTDIPPTVEVKLEDSFLSNIMININPLDFDNFGSFLEKAKLLTKVTLLMERSYTINSIILDGSYQTKNDSDLKIKDKIAILSTVFELMLENENEVDFNNSLRKAFSMILEEHDRQENDQSNNVTKHGVDYDEKTIKHHGK